MIETRHYKSFLLASYVMNASHRVWVHANDVLPWYESKGEINRVDKKSVLLGIGRETLKGECFFRGGALTYKRQRGVKTGSP